MVYTNATGNIVQLELFYIDGLDLEVSEDTKRCKSCDEVKPLIAFPKQWGYEKGVMNTCKKCRNYDKDIRNKILRTAPKKPTKCDCCGVEENGKLLHLDHCYKTEKFRGWICMNCNSGIGKLGDNLTGVKKALDYLTKAENKKGA